MDRIEKEVKEQTAEWALRIRRANLTQGDFAILANVTQGNLSTWIRGRMLPSVKSFVKVENALKKLGV